MHHATVVLRRTDIRRILESDPWVARFEQHHQHFTPQILGWHALVELDFTSVDHGLILLIAFLERFAIKIMQIWHITRAEERPLGSLFYTFHEQVWNPVGSVHVMRTAALVASVAAQF